MENRMDITSDSEIWCVKVNCHSREKLGICENCDNIDYNIIPNTYTDSLRCSRCEKLFLYHICSCGASNRLPENLVQVREQRKREEIERKIEHDKDVNRDNLVKKIRLIGYIGFIVTFVAFFACLFSGNWSVAFFLFLIIQIFSFIAFFRNDG
jgi:hypothetical protein